MKDARIFAREDLQLLLELLKQRGFEILGPRAADGMISFAPLSSADQLPWGVEDEQEAGRYRLADGPANRAFFWTSAAQSIKPLAFPAAEGLWQVRFSDDGRPRFSETLPAPKPIAIIGVRACDLAALELLDRHFYDKGDPWYRARRDALCTVAVNCARSAATCFCRSTGDGPSVNSRHDLLLDEIEDGFVIQAGSPLGEALIADCDWQPASAEHLADAKVQTEAAASTQTRSLPEVDLESMLGNRANVAAWQKIGEQCLACGNCTAVCPSCFCHRHTEEPALDAASSSHGREWDSCFSNDHSLMHGQPHRREISHRYRQWLSHKLGGWHSQYGRSGCTGCGRCITWCPVGIDLTRSVSAVLKESAA